MMQSASGALVDSIDSHDNSSIGTATLRQHPAAIAEEYWRQMLPDSLVLSVDVESETPAQCNKDANDEDTSEPDADEGANATAFEPSREPCSGDIPWADLVFWLGDAATGRVEACSCASCWKEWQRARVQRRQRHKSAYSPYGRLSSKIPVINLPRIEGVN